MPTKKEVAKKKAEKMKSHSPDTLKVTYGSDIEAQGFADSEKVEIKKQGTVFTHIIFYSAVDRTDKRDSSKVFLPFARELAQADLSHYLLNEQEQDSGCSLTTAVVAINCRNEKSIKRKRVATMIEGFSNVRAISFFGHGYQDGFEFGDTLGTIKYSEMLQAMRAQTELRYINLYCCSCAQGSVNFAERVAELLEPTHPDIKIFAHWNSGHAVLNACIDFISPAYEKTMYISRQDNPPENCEVQINKGIGAFDEIKRCLDFGLKSDKWKIIPYSATPTGILSTKNSGTEKEKTEQLYKTDVISRVISGKKAKE